MNMFHIYMYLYLNWSIVSQFWLRRTLKLLEHSMSTGVILHCLNLHIPSLSSNLQDVTGYAGTSAVLAHTVYIMCCRDYLSVVV